MSVNLLSYENSLGLFQEGLVESRSICLHGTEYILIFSEKIKKPDCSLMSAAFLANAQLVIRDDLVSPRPSLRELYEDAISNAPNIEIQISGENSGDMSPFHKEVIAQEEMLGDGYEIESGSVVVYIDKLNRAFDECFMFSAGPNRCCMLIYYVG